MSCTPGIQPRRIVTPHHCGCVDAAKATPVQRAAGALARVQAALKDMPGVHDSGAYEVGYSPYLIVQLNGPAHWRMARVAMNAGLRRDPLDASRYIDPKSALPGKPNTAIAVLFQSMQYPLELDPAHPITAQALADPPYVQALARLRGATEATSDVRAAQGLIRSEELWLLHAQQEGVNPFAQLPQAWGGFSACAQGSGGFSRSYAR